MNIVKENIQEENIEDNKNNITINNEKNKDINDDNENSNNNKKEDNPVFSHKNMRGTISEEEINNSSKLIIEEIEGNIFNGKKKK